MAIRSGFFNSVSGDRKYDAKRFAEYFASFIGNGVFPNPSDNLQVISNNNMTVTVRPGKAWINGYILVNDDDYILSIDVADGVLKRIDRIVARYDVANRGITLAVKKGIFASTPSAPALQRDEDIYELGIADILISNGAVSITQGNITDLRMNSTYCGIVTGVVDQIDATNLFAQYDAEFRDWFAGLEDVLDENVAANLLNLINAHKADYEYQVPTIVGTQIRLQKQSNTNILKFKLSADLSGGEITISLDGGATSKPLKDIEGNILTELDTGFVEVVENAVNFTYAPKGGKVIKGLIITPSTVNQAIPKGMHDGLGYVKGDANLLAENIKKDKNIFDVIGTLSECKKFSQSFSQPEGFNSISHAFNPGFNPVLTIGQVVLDYQQSSSSWYRTYYTQIIIGTYFPSEFRALNRILIEQSGGGNFSINSSIDGYGLGKNTFVTLGGAINYTTSRTIVPSGNGCHGVTSCSVTCYYME